VLLSSPVILLQKLLEKEQKERMSYPHHPVVYIKAVQVHTDLENSPKDNPTKFFTG
jgi:hypothetical protein